MPVVEEKEKKEDQKFLAGSDQEDIRCVGGIPHGPHDGS